MLNNIERTGMPGLATRSGGDDSIELPAVIRPVRIELRAVEQRLLDDRPFAAAMAAHPDVAARLARAIFSRDPHARARFGDQAALARHLAAVRNG